MKKHNKNAREAEVISKKREKNGMASSVILIISIAVLRFKKEKCIANTYTISKEVNLES